MADRYPNDTRKELEYILEHELLYGGGGEWPASIRWSQVPKFVDLIERLIEEKIQRSKEHG